MIQPNAKIVIASVLKPVDDVRNYEKIGCSLAKQAGLEVHILGTEGNIQKGRILPHSWKPFRRLSFGRLMIQWQYLTKLKAIRPDLIVVTTHELLLASVLYKMTFGAKIIYDVQEDYFKNLWHQHFYPALLRHMMAIVLRMIEYMCSPFISAFFLAEKTYLNDLNFIGNRGLVLDNKSLEIAPKNKPEHCKVVFTGTISHYSQATESIELFLKLKGEILEAEMVVVGYCPQASYRQTLERNYGSKVRLKIEDRPVSHSEIVKEIATSHLAIIGYQPDPVNHQKIPTKLYEYIVAGVPFLVQENTLWATEGVRLGTAIPIDFKSPNFTRLREHIASSQSKSSLISECLWSKNEGKLFEKVSSIIHFDLHS